MRQDEVIHVYLYRSAKRTWKKRTVRSASVKTFELDLDFTHAEELQSVSPSDSWTCLYPVFDLSDNIRSSNSFKETWMVESRTLTSFFAVVISERKILSATGIDASE